MHSTWVCSLFLRKPLSARIEKVRYATGVFNMDSGSCAQTWSSMVSLLRIGRFLSDHVQLYVAVYAHPRRFLFHPSPLRKASGAFRGTQARRQANYMKAISGANGPSSPSLNHATWPFGTLRGDTCAPRPRAENGGGNLHGI